MLSEIANFLRFCAACLFIVGAGVGWLITWPLAALHRLFGRAFFVY